MRRKDQKQVYGMTFYAADNQRRQKDGKTQKGALWLDPEKTSPYEFYQYWINVEDADVINCLKLITFVPMEEIREMEKWEGKQLNEAKRRLAYEVTAMVHGKEEAEKAKKASEALFGGGEGGEVPSTKAEGEINIVDALVLCKLAPSKGEARRLITQGGVMMNEEKVSDHSLIISAELLKKGVLFKEGRRVSTEFIWTNKSLIAAGGALDIRLEYPVKYCCIFL